MKLRTILGVAALSVGIATATPSADVTQTPNGVCSRDLECVPEPVQTPLIDFVPAEPILVDGYLPTYPDGAWATWWPEYCPPEDITDTPEPASYLAMVSGLAVIGFLRRRR